MVRLSISFLLVSLSSFGATFPQWFTTNSQSGIAAPSDGWIMAWSNPVPVWTLQGRLLTNLNLVQATNNDVLVSNALYSIIQASTNSLVNPTNNDVAVSNNLYLEIVSATNNALLLATNNDLLIGLHATNNDTVVSNGLYSQIVGSTNGPLWTTNSSGVLLTTDPTYLDFRVGATIISYSPNHDVFFLAPDFATFGFPTNSTDSVAIGDHAMTDGNGASNVRMDAAIGIGEYALADRIAPGSDDIIALGQRAGAGVFGGNQGNIGSDQIYLGKYAGYSGSSPGAFVWTGIGYEALRGVSASGLNWICMGSGAGYQWSGDGDDRIWLGNNGHIANPATGSDWVFIGRGHTISGNGSDRISIGAVNHLNGTNAIAIGRNLTATNNQFVLGDTNNSIIVNGTLFGNISGGSNYNLINATNNDLLIGLNGSNNVMAASNTLWLSASNLVYQGTNVSISQKVSTNESRSLVFTSATNRLGTNVNADFFWGDISHGTGLTAGQIPNIAESQVTGLPGDLDARVTTNTSRSLVWTSSTNNLGTNVSAVTFYGALNGNAATATTATSATTATYVTGNNAPLTNHIPIANVDSPGVIMTNGGTTSITYSNTFKLDAAHALSLSNLTTGHVLQVGADSTVSSVSSSAVPIDGDGTATTSAQVNALFPSNILTNNNANATVFSNTLKFDAAHALSLSNIAASKVLRTAADSTVAAVTIGTGVAFDGTTLTATGSGGTVTSVGVAGANGLTVSGSPVSGSGTITVGAQADILTNNLAFATVISNTMKFDAAHALSLSNATASHVLQVGADSTITSVSSGAVPIDGNGSATTFPQVNALASADILTNNLAFAVVISNTIKIDAAHALSLSNSTASHVLQVGADSTVSSVSSGAVPIDGNGSATTFAQVNALAGADILTNNLSFATVISNTLKMDAAHALSLSNVAASKILRTAADSTVAAVTIGSGVSFDGTILTATGSGGTVTSVGVSGANGLTVSGSPVSGSGTITVGAQADILTNNLAFAAVISNTIKMDVSHALSLSNATASHVLQVGADSTVTSVSSGAVPIDGNGSATTFAQVNALAGGDILTNNLGFAAVISNTIKMDAAHALSLSNATASHVLKVGADSTVTSVASGAVPIDGDGTATTFAQVNALAADILTNGTTLSVTFSNNTAVDAAHTLTANGPLTVGGVSTVVDVVGSGTNALNITAATNNVVWKTANYALLANDTFVFISGNHTTTMPPPSNPSCYGKWYYINVSSAGTNAILPNGAETFNGSSGTALAKLTNTAVGKLISLYSNRTNWWYVINP